MNPAYTESEQYKAAVAKQRAMRRSSSANPILKIMKTTKHEAMIQLRNSNAYTEDQKRRMREKAKGMKDPQFQSMLVRSLVKYKRR